MDEYKFKYINKDEFQRILRKARRNQPENIETYCSPTQSQRSTTTYETQTSISEASVVSSVPRSEAQSSTSQQANTVNYGLTKTCDNILKIQLSIESLLCGMRDQFETANKVLEPGGENEPTSARAAKNREIRLSEFNARFRRNYIYPLQIEIDRAVNHFGNCEDLTIYKCIEKSLLQAFRACQVFYQQSRSLKELLVNYTLIGELLAQLSRVSSICAGLNIPCKSLDIERQNLKAKLSHNALDEDLARMKLTATPPRKTFVRKNKSKPAQRNKSQNRLIQPKAHKMFQQSCKESEAPREDEAIGCRAHKMFQQSCKESREDEAIGCRSHKMSQQSCKESEAPREDKATQVQQLAPVQNAPVNVKVFLMQHEALPTEVHEMSTQTLDMHSRAVGTEQFACGEDCFSDSASSFSQSYKVQDIPLALKLQKEILERLAGDDNKDLDQLIEQLMQEEFL